MEAYAFHRTSGGGRNSKKISLLGGPIVLFKKNVWITNLVVQQLSHISNDSHARARQERTLPVEVDLHRCTCPRRVCLHGMG